MSTKMPGIIGFDHLLWTNTYMHKCKDFKIYQVTDEKMPWSSKKEVNSIFLLLVHSVSNEVSSSDLVSDVYHRDTYSYIKLCKSKQLMIDEQWPQNFISIQQRYCACTTTCSISKQVNEWVNMLVSKQPGSFRLLSFWLTVLTQIRTKTS